MVRMISLAEMPGIWGFHGPSSPSGITSLGLSLAPIDQHQHPCADARVTSPSNALGDLPPALHRFDGLIAVPAPIGKVFGVVPGEVLGAPGE